jgi:hypothetical protein
MVKWARLNGRHDLARPKHDTTRVRIAGPAPVWQARLGPLLRHAGRHGHDPFKWVAQFGPLYLPLHIKNSYICHCLNILYIYMSIYDNMFMFIIICMLKLSKL